MMLPCCDQTVTVYRKERDGVTRWVIRGVYFHHKDYRNQNNLGARQGQEFLLIIPGGGFIPCIGDRVMAGLGPKKVDWETFRPGFVRGLGEVGYVTTGCLNGKVHHHEAGAGSAR